MKRLFLLVIIVVFLVASTGIAMALGNGRSGYNWKAKVFVGTGCQWCMQKFGDTWGTEEACRDYLGPYANDMLVMKWSKAWHDAVFGPDGVRDSGDELPWTSDAWCSNEWNGMFPGGSGETWHYKQKYNEESKQIEIIMSHGTYEGEHLWDIHEIPSGYGQ